LGVPVSSVSRVTANEYVVVLTTMASAAEARKLVRHLVDQRLIACGSVLPGATSVYRWRGDVTEEEEVVVLMKTTRSRWDALRAAVTQQHPYEVPELLALPVRAGLESYLSWVSAEVA
jgi:periplasmic divalent cation tolerance protein